MEEWHRVLVESGNRIRTAPSAGVLFADLLTGEVHRVSSVHKAQEHYRAHSVMPDDVVQTFFSHLLSKSELATLQTEHDFQPKESVLRGEAFVILD